MLWASPRSTLTRKFNRETILGKWDKEHLKDLSDDEYREVVKDIEELKEKYNYIEYIKDTFKGEYKNFPFWKKVLLSKEDLKK